MNILITGAASGIARALIQTLLLKEHHLYLSFHNEKQLELAKKRYEGKNNVYLFVLDVTNKEDRLKVKDMDIDVFINNVAIGESGSIMEIPRDKVRHNFEVNVFGNFSLLQIVIQNMIKKNNGRIINIGSLAGIIPLPFLGPYASTKASIHILTKTLQKEIKLLHKRIDIILVEPGMYHTGFNQVMFEEKYDWMHVESYFQEQIDTIRK